MSYELKVKIIGTWTLAMLIAWGGQAQLRIVPDRQPQTVFGGASQKVTVQLQNAGERRLESELRIALFQASAATAVRVSELAWKRLQMLPGQTLIDSVTMTFPTVKAPTRFVVQWLENTNHVLGTTEVFVYPTNLLTQLKAVAGEEPLGVFDPANELKPLLRALTVKFVDMQEAGTDKFRGELAIFGPFESGPQMRASLKKDIRALTKRGVAVVCLMPPSDQHAAMKPSFYVVREGEGAVVVASHGLVAGLAGRPEAQLNLLQLAQESLHPTALTLPETEISN